MAKAVLISIRPEWVEKIANGEKTLELRKTEPKLETPFKVYIYCTAGNLSYEVSNGMFCNISGGRVVVGEFVCDKIGIIWGGGYLKMPESAFAGSCLNMYQIDTYLDGKDGHFWHISNLKIYDAPKPLSKFMGLRKTKFGYAPVEIKRPPQSWCYVEELK
jgi:predicted transcriptional regulator